MKKMWKITAVLLIALCIVLICVRVFGRSGENYMDADRVVMRIEGSDITWSEFYGWLCYARVQTEAVLGTAITSWDDEVETGTTIADYVKSYALYLIETHKAVEYNAAVIGIELTDAELDELYADLDSLTDAERQTVYDMYGGEEMYKYMMELDALYTKCHDYQYGENGENADDEYVEEYISDFGVMSFYGALLPDGEDGEAIADQVNAAEDKQGEIARLREQYENDDEYGGVYIFVSDGFDEDAEEELADVPVGECTYAATDDGIYIMLRCEPDYDGIVYNTENTLREQASWDVFASVVNGWVENMQIMTGDTYNSIDLGRVFG